jgi:hypothetical protein
VLEFSQRTRIEAGREALIAGLCESPLTFQAIIMWRLAMAISPSRDKSSIERIPCRYLPIGSSVRSDASAFFKRTDRRHLDFADLVLCAFLHFGFLALIVSSGLASTAAKRPHQGHPAVRDRGGRLHSGAGRTG